MPCVYLRPFQGIRHLSLATQKRTAGKENRRIDKQINVVELTLLTVRFRVNLDSSYSIARHNTETSVNIWGKGL